MPAKSRRSSGTSEIASPTSTRSSSMSVGDNGFAAEQLSAPAASGPFSSPFLNGALSEAFGSDLSGLSATTDIAKNESVWSVFEPDRCDDPTHRCRTALSAPPTVTDVAVFAGTLNGIAKDYDVRTGILGGH